LRKDASDADLAVLDAQLRAIAPFAAAEQKHVVTVDTLDEAPFSALVLRRSAP
jgi:predicted kinase